MDILGIIALFFLAYYNYMLGVKNINKLYVLLTGLILSALSAITQQMWLFAFINFVSISFIVYGLIKRR